MPDAAKNAAFRFFDLLPPAMPLEVLEQYGLGVTIPQAQIITKEIIALSIYWIRCALQAGIPEEFGKTVRKYLDEQIQHHWENKFGLETVSFEKFLDEVDSRQRTWDELTVRGADPITVLRQAASDLDEDSVLAQGYQQSLLALFLDFVPIEEIGTVAEAIEEGSV